MPICRPGGGATLRRELRGPMFDLAEPLPPPPKGGDAPSAADAARTLDVARTFSPSPRRACLPARLAILAWLVSILAMDVDFWRGDLGAFWLAYLTSWGTVLAVAYAAASLAAAGWLAARPPEHPGALEGVAGALAMATWALFAVAFPAQVLTSILYWALTFEGGTPSYLNVATHGVGAALVAVDGLLLGRIPLRARQFALFWLYSATYVLWTVVHAYSGIGNPRNDGIAQTDDALYPDVLAWKNSPGSTAVLSVLVLLVACPVVFALCRWVSRLPPRRLHVPEDGIRPQRSVEEAEERPDP